MITNCKNCGAPIHNGRCDYCGTEYKTLCDDVAQTYRIDTYTHQVDTLACKVAIPIQMREYMTDEQLKEIAMRDIIWDLIDKLKDYVELETWQDIYNCKTMIGGRIRVGRP